jgi:hypothetical protein
LLQQLTLLTLHELTSTIEEDSMFLWIWIPLQQF